MPGAGLRGRTSADLGAEVAEIRQQIAALEGSIAEVRNSTETNQRELNKTRLDLDTRPLRRVLGTVA